MTLSATSMCVQLSLSVLSQAASAANVVALCTPPRSYVMPQVVCHFANEVVSLSCSGSTSSGANTL